MLSSFSMDEYDVQKLVWRGIVQLGVDGVVGFVKCDEVYVMWLDKSRWGVTWLCSGM